LCRGLAEAEMLIKEGLRQAAVLGVDETNLRVSKRQDWVHVSSTDKLTLLVHDKRRGATAISEIDILPRYEGVVVHDGFSAYEQYAQCRHAQCNAHILRDLNYVIETSKPQWAVEMKALQLKIKGAVNEARENGREGLTPRQQRRLLSEYDEAIEKAEKIYGRLKLKRGQSKTLKAVESPLLAAARKLAGRMRDKKDQILLFMHDFDVPFDRYERRSQRQRSPVPLRFVFDGHCSPTPDGGGPDPARGFVCVHVITRLAHSLNTPCRGLLFASPDRYLMLTPTGRPMVRSGLIGEGLANNRDSAS
jgi:hypothetical protein